MQREGLRRRGWTKVWDFAPRDLPGPPEEWHDGSQRAERVRSRILKEKHSGASVRERDVAPEVVSSKGEG